MKIADEYLHLIFDNDLIYIADEAEHNHEPAAETLEDTAIKSTAHNNAEDGHASDVANEKPATYNKANKVVILVDKVLDSDSRLLLEKILAAVNFIFDEAAIIEEHPDKFSDLAGTELFLSFHPNYSPKGKYELNVVNSIRVIYAHPLSELNKNIDYKKQLWDNLKKLV